MSDDDCPGYDEVDRDEDLDSDCYSEESVEIEDVLSWAVDDSVLSYTCRTTDGTIETFDRSDLMDCGKQQALVMAFERKCPPPWDEVCTWCDGDGCEECICDECERPMRHINGVNYGCVKHPVV